MLGAVCGLFPDLTAILSNFLWEKKNLFILERLSPQIIISMFSGVHLLWSFLLRLCRSVQPNGDSVTPGKYKYNDDIHVDLICTASPRPDGRPRADLTPHVGECTSRVPVLRLSTSVPTCTLHVLSGAGMTRITSACIIH